MSNGGQQRSTYVEAHAVAYAAVQQHMAQQAAQARLAGPGPSVAPQPTNATFTLPDDGLGYDDGVRVLRSIGSWFVYERNILLLLLYVVCYDFKISTRLKKKSASWKYHGITFWKW